MSVVVRGKNVAVLHETTVVFLESTAVVLE
jgi:hypothetical protein